MMNDINNRIAKLSPTKRKLLEQRLQQKVKEANRQLTIPPRENPHSAPLSYAQERMWILDKLEPANPAYNRPLNIRLTGSLNVVALEKSINELVRRHEIFRTSFSIIDGQPIQVIAPSLTVNLPIVKLSDLPINEREKESDLMATEAAQHKFDLSQLPLITAKLLHLSETENILLLTMHHIIFDGWSVAVFLKELAAHYQAFVMGEASPLLPLPIQYADFAVWQRQRLQGEVLESQLAYWKKQLSGSLPVLELPTDRRRSPVQTFRGAKQDLLLPKHLSDSLKELSLREEVTLFMTLLAAFKILLYRYTGEEDMIVGTPIARRDRLETENLIGVFINTLVLRCHCDGNSTFREFLNQVRQVALEAFAHQELPFEKLVEELKPDRDLSHTPIFQVLFQLRNLPQSSVTAAGIGFEELKGDREITAFDLTLDILETSSGLVCSFNYNRDLFDAATIERMAGHFQVLLSGIVANPHHPVYQLPLLTEKEQHQLLVAWNDTATDYPQDKCIHQLFEEQVERTPDAVAVVFEDEKLTYRELNNRANQLAHYLRSLGVEPEVLVGICVERSLEMIVGLLGILKAGGAYVPLDPNYPPERVDYILSNSAAQVLITSGQVLNYLPKYKIRIICLDTELKEIERENKKNPNSKVKSQNLLYVIYTSGSTGEPKGVAICHYSLVNLINSMSDKPGLTSRDRILAITTICFDIHTLEIYLPLTVGATIILASKEVAINGVKLAEQLANSGLSVMQATPATWQMLFNAKWSGNPELKAICGGETLSQPLANCLLEKVGSLWNIYGPTETTVWATTSEVNLNRVNRHQDAAESIGRPIANTQIYILDKYLQPVPIGIPGEIHIGGAGLARGYLNHPELTEEKFIPNPFSNEPSSRLYKTGDLGRYLPDGNIEFIGRIDTQVKIRGFRIELGEIEAVLRQHPNIKESLVLAREDIPGDKRLVAYIVPTQEEVPTLDSLRHFLKQKLPNYMMPAAFVVLEAFPLTPNGKIDRRALAVPDRLGQNSENTHVAPRNSLEQKLAEIWGKVLWLDRKVGIHDNFFDLGGHSLLSVRLVAEIEKAFNQQLPVAALFQLSTIAELAPLLQLGEETTENTAVEGKSTPLLPNSSLDPEIYRQLLAYTAGWQGKRIADNALMVGVNTEGSQQPLFWCFQGFRELTQLAKYLGTDQPLYGMRSGHQAMKKIPENSTALAAHYVQEILTVQPQGPYLLGGNCQGGRVTFEIAQQLWQRGKVITLLALLENPEPTPYPGRLALLFGRDSQFNPYRSFWWPEWGWRKFYPGGFSVDLIPCRHGQFFNEPNVQILAETLQTYIQAAPTIPTPSPVVANQITYPILPDVAYQAQLTAPLFLFAKPGEIIDVAVTVKNISPVAWPDSQASGITLGNHWLDTDGNMICGSDGRVALLQDLHPNADVVLSLSVKAPNAVGEYILELDLVEEGVTWFQQKGSKTTGINVKVSENPVLIHSESRLKQIQADLARSRTRLSQIKAFLE